MKDGKVDTTALAAREERKKRLAQMEINIEAADQRRLKALKNVEDAKKIARNLAAQHSRALSEKEAFLNAESDG